MNIFPIKRFISFFSPPAYQTPRAERKRAYFVKVFSLIGIISCLPYALIYALYGMWETFTYCCFFEFIFVVNYLLARRGYHRIAKHGFLTAANISIFYFSLIIGKSSGIYNLFIAIACTTAIVHGNQERKAALTHFASSIGLYLLLQYLFLPAGSNISAILTLEFSLFLTSFFCSIIIVFFFTIKQSSTSDKAEHKLNQNQERLRALLNAIPDLMLRIDEQGVIKDYTLKDGSTLISGNKQIKNATLDEIFTHEISTQLQKAIENPVRGIQAIALRDERNETQKHYEARIVKSNDQETIIIIRDFTEQKETQAQLQQIESNLSAVFENSNQAFILLDQKFRIVAINPKGSEYLEYITEKALAKGDQLQLETVIAGHSFKSLYSTALAGKTTKIEQEIQRNTKTPSFLEVSYSPAYSGEDNITGVLISVTDISDHKLHEKILENAKEEAEAGIRAKSLFLSNMSHEIRTPLNAIIGFTDLLLHEKFDKTVGESIQAIKYSAENLQLLVSDVLDISKIESGKITLEKIDFSPRHVLEQSIKLIRLKAQDKGIELHTDVSPTIPDALNGDPLRLNQIILNLASNAVKFTDKGKVEIKVSNKQTDGDLAMIKIEVLDTGIGIPKIKLEHIFDSFTQAETNTTRKYGGTGLGLTITKQLVELQDGSISVESTEGLGSAFTIQIPYQLAEKAITVSTKNQENKNVILSGAKVLIVEDNVFNQLLLSKILKVWDIDADTANNGFEAIEKLSDKHYDLVLMDIHMPKMNGLEATYQIRHNTTGKINKEIPIVAISADAYAESKNQALQSGMNSYITKPFKQQELYQLLCTFIGPKEGKSLSTSQENIYARHEISEESPELNIDYLKNYLCSDDAMLSELLQLYLSTTSESLRQAATAFANGEYIAVREAAHKMKSSFVSIGYKRTSQLVMLVEKNAGLPEQHGFVAKLLEIITADFEKSKKTITEIMKSLAI